MKRTFTVSKKSIKASREEGRRFWYFTTHGVGPGSVPKGVHILDIQDGQNNKGTWGEFVAFDRALTDDELKYYDLRPQLPRITSSRRSKLRRYVASTAWKYRLRNGANLRKAIYDDDVKGSLEELINCYKELISAGMLSEDDGEGYIADAAGYLDDFNQSDDADLYDEDVFDTMNDLLDTFYDVCDDIGVWVSLTEYDGIGACDRKQVRIGDPSITDKRQSITSADDDIEVTEEYINDLYTQLGDELADMQTVIYDTDDRNIYLTVTTETNNIYEFTVPIADLGKGIDVDVKYILDSIRAKIKDNFDTVE